MSPKRIGIDARCFQDGSVYRGTGRYLRGLLMGLSSCTADDLDYELVLDDSDCWEHGDPPGLGRDGRLYGYQTRRAAVQVRRYSRLRRLQRIWAVNRSLRGLGLDLFHIPAQFYLYNRQWFRLPYVVTVLDLIPFLHLEREMSATRRRRHFRRLDRLTSICQRAAGIVAISAHTRDDCVRMMGIPAERITVIPLGVEGHFNPDERGDSEVLERHGLRGPYVLYVGAQDHHKNLHTLIAAVRRLREGGRDLRLVLVGRKGKKPPGRDEPWIVYPNYVPDEELPALYRAASVFVTLSAYEGFCLPAVEAMACGTPIVASNTSVLPETVGDAGLCVDPMDADAAARAIDRVLGNESLAEELCKRGLERARSYRWEEVGRAHLEVYRCALSGSRDPLRGRPPPAAAS